MSKISYSEYELQVLMAFHKKMEQREDAIISFVCFGHSKANWEEKPNYREPSLKEKYEKSFKTLVVKGDIYRLSEDEYACNYTKKELKQKIKEYQKPSPPISNGSNMLTIRIDDIDKIDAPITSSTAFDDGNSGENYGDDLDLDDDDDLDFSEVIKFRKMMYDESKSSNSKKNEVVDTDKTIVELDKLLEEVIDERGVTSTGESTRFIERDFIFVDEIESKCEYLILKIVASDIKQDRQGAINIAQAVLDKAKIKAGENSEDTIVTICEHVVEEFVDCSDEDYSKLKNDVWG